MREPGIKISAQTVTVHTRHTFAIARSASDSFRRVILSVEQDGAVGRGEAAPTARYGQSAGETHSALESITVEDPWDIEGALAANSGLPTSALAALDAALYDLAARRLGVPVHRLLGLGKPAPASAYTLAIADRETTLRRARELSEYPILKMKVGDQNDIETVRAVVGESEAEVWVDANEAFAPGEAVEVARELAGMGVSLIEQPVPAHEGPDALRGATEAAAPVPVIADESALIAKDVPQLAGCVSGVNVKLTKCGGVRRALEMIHTARSSGMAVMLGCMVETSLGIAAAAQISGLVDFVDLDGAMLLADDPFAGPEYERGRILLSDEPGLGVRPR